MAISFIHFEFYTLYNGILARDLISSLCCDYAVIFTIFTKVCHVLDSFHLWCQQRISHISWYEIFSCLMMKFCVVLACSTSPTSSVNKGWVSLVMSPDFKLMYRQTRSFESVPRQETVTGLRRSGDAPAVVHPPPGSTRSTMT